MENVFYLTAPAKNKDIKVRGKELKDKVVYLIKVPEDANVEVISKKETNTNAEVN